MTNVKIRIQEVYEALSVVEKKVADYFLEHTEEVFNLPIGELASRSGVSKVAWVRFSKALGFEGLKDLKKALFAEIKKNADETAPPLPFSDVGDAENISVLLESTKSNAIRAIQDTATLLDAKAVEMAAQKILCADSVRIFGVGASGLVGEDLQSKLLRINKNAFFSLDHHLQLVYAANMSVRDVAVLISMSGNTKEVLEILALAKDAGTPVIAITKFGKNTLSQSADIVFHVSAPEIAQRSGAMSSRIAQLLAVDVLFSAVAHMDYDHVSVHLEKSRNSTRSHHL